MTVVSRRSLQESAALLCKPLVQKFISSFKLREDDTPEAKKAGQQAQNLKWQQEMLHQLLKMVRLHSEGLVNETEVLSLRESILNEVTSLHDKGEWPELTRDKLLFLQDLFYTNCISEADYHEAKGLLIIRLIAQGAEMDLNDIILLRSAPDTSCTSGKRGNVGAEKHVDDAMNSITCSKLPAPGITTSQNIAKTSLRTPHPIHSLITKDCPSRDPPAHANSDKCSSPLFHSPIDNIVSQGVAYAQKFKVSSSSLSKCKVGVESSHAPSLKSTRLQSTLKPSSPSAASLAPITNRMKLLIDFMRKLQSDTVNPSSYEEVLEDGSENHEEVALKKAFTKVFEAKPVGPVVKTTELEESQDDVKLAGHLGDDGDTKMKVDEGNTKMTTELEESQDDIKVAGHLGDDGDTKMKVLEGGSDKEEEVASKNTLRTQVFDARPVAPVVRTTELEESPDDIKLAGHIADEGDTKRKVLEGGSDKEEDMASKNALRMESSEARPDAPAMKTTEPEESQKAKIVGYPVDESNTRRISDIMAIKKKLQTKSAAANFFIDKVLGENIRKELRKICTETKQADGSRIFTNDQIETIAVRLPADEIELRRLFPKCWCDSHGNMVLKVVAKAFEDHVRELKDIRKSRKKRMTEIKHSSQNDENANSNLHGPILQSTPKKGKESSQNMPAARCFTSMDVNTIQERQSPYQHTKSSKMDHRNELAEKLQEENQKMVEIQ
ncbi:hypothetical protein O6H91_10G074100 [Diphasiastrum complanatum]|uniref:Uncharacterized protein n=1 Tax=Diphasiastrum complanatum TaxID=34168 RepID=A0ACC2CI94_DIPCM|nr:hypothetical protein O6H91_10G074100 [Diphasiastrum complanatum]